MVNSMHKNFIDAGIDSVNPIKNDWFSSDGWDVKLASDDLKSATIFLADGNFLEAAHRSANLASGWVLLSSHEMERTVSVSNLIKLVKRIGVLPSRTVVVSNEKYWNCALDLVEQWGGARAVLFSDAKKASYDSIYSTDAVENPVSRIINSTKVQDSIVLMIPQSSIVDTGDVVESIEIVKYWENDVFSKSINGYQKYIHNFMKLNDVINASGDIWKYLSRMVASKINNGTPSFLPKILGKSEFGRRALVQMDFSKDGGILVFGFDLDVHKKSENWGSRKHSVLFEDLGTGENIEFDLGVLRREALDVLNIYPFMSTTQSFAAFGLPSNAPLSLEFFSSGRYRVSILDEVGFDITSIADFRILTESFGNIKILVEGQRIIVEKG